jgi:hypothetical protein
LTVLLLLLLQMLLLSTAALSPGNPSVAVLSEYLQGYDSSKSSMLWEGL